MKIIATSELTIYDELKKICEVDNVLVDKKVALRTEAIKKANEQNKKYAREFSNIVFQSKNAVRYSKDLHSYLLSNKKSTMYCLGKFTMIEIKKHFINRIKHPESNYSSESLLDLIKEKSVERNDYLIIKGEDGRDYLEKEIKKLGGNVEVAELYKRVPIEAFIKEEDVIEGMNNYLLVSSKIALDELIKNIIKFKYIYDLILVIPNKRLSENIKKSLFKDIIIICNSDSAKTYIKTIGIHNEKN